MVVQSLGFRTDLMLRRLGGSFVEQHDGWVVVRTPSNPGFWWGNFLLSPAPLRRGDAERWEAGFRRFFPDAEHRAFGVDSPDGAAGDPDEIARLGLTQDCSDVLVATALRQPSAVAAECRLLAGTDDWEQAVRLRLDTDGGPPTAQHRAFLRARVAEQQCLVEQGSGGWFGAFVDGCLVSGLGVFSDGSGVARYQDVVTAAGARRRGLASHLLLLAAHWAREALAAHTLVIVADVDGPASRLYQSLGFVPAQRQVQLAGQPARPPQDG